MAPQLAWLGLGNMGRGMCKNLVEKGDLTSPLIIYNRTTSRAEALSTALGGPSKTTVASSIHDAVAPADIIFTCVGADADIISLIATAASTCDLSSKLFVDCSTVHPDTTDALARTLSTAGASFVAMPVFGAPAMADAGALVCVCAGPAPLVARVKPYTVGVLGRALIDYSDAPHGTATRLKIIGNTFILNMVETLSEGHTLAEKSGLGSDRLHQFVETMFPGPYAAYSDRLRSGDYHKRAEPLFAVDLARKDAGHALGLAEACGARMRDVEVADEHLEEVKRHMGARGDISSIYGAVRVESGLPFEN